MIGRGNYLLLREVAERLADQPDLGCALAADLVRDTLTVVLTVPAEGNLAVVELAQELAYLSGVGTVRAFAAQYGIAAADLEPLITRAIQKKEIVDEAHTEDPR